MYADGITHRLAAKTRQCAQGEWLLAVRAGPIVTMDEKQL